MKTGEISMESRPLFLEVRHRGKRTLLPSAKIFHIDASGTYTTIHSEDYPPVMVAKVLKKYQHLLQDHGFIRINNSILINTHKVREIQHDGGVIMEDASMFYPSRRRKGLLQPFLKITI